MDNQKNNPESPLSPEEQLDLLLESFMVEDLPLPKPTPIPEEEDLFEKILSGELEITETTDETPAEELCEPEEIPEVEEVTELLADFPALADIVTDIGPDEDAIADVELTDLEDPEPEAPAEQEDPEIEEADDTPCEDIDEALDELAEEDLDDEEAATEEMLEIEDETATEEAAEIEDETATEEAPEIEDETATEEAPEIEDETATEEAAETEDEPSTEDTEGTAPIESEEHASEDAAKEEAEEQDNVFLITFDQPEEEADDEAEAEDADEEKDEADEEEELPPLKRRPRNPKAYGFFGLPHIVVTLIWLGMVTFIGVGLGLFAWNCAADVLALGRPDSVVTITITDDDTLETVAQKLKKTGLIRYSSLFTIYGDISDAMDSIRSGTYELNTLYDYHALVDAMSSNQRRVVVNVTIPEGYTTAQIFRLLEAYGISTVAEMEDAVVNGELGEYWFLEGVERNSVNCLEGFLFPDTYTFYLDHDPTNILQKFLNNFNKRFNEKMKIKLDTLNLTLSEQMRANGLSEEYIAEHQLTVRDVVIIASMIEKESASNPESYLISSVIYNRLTNPKEYPYLNIDATLVYVLGHGDLTYEDLKYDSPYNTYLYPGLIPGAISNPGIYSLDAALDPTETAYYFYALNPSTGEHKFSETLKEHQDFLESIRNSTTEEEPAE